MHSKQIALASIPPGLLTQPKTQYALSMWRVQVVSYQLENKYLVAAVAAHACSTDGS